MKKTRVAVVGFGNVGKETVIAVRESPDMMLEGIILRNPEKIPVVKEQVQDVPVVTDVGQLGKIDVAILAISSRAVPEVASRYLEMGINTVDSFDIHGDAVINLRKDLDKIAKENNSVSIISAGWDPGTDSVVRTLMEIIAPKGLTYTNFGPGMSMGHTVVAKSIEGVENAISMTIPMGTGIHKRLVYVKLKPGYKLDEVSSAIKKDPYFIHDETYVYEVNDVDSLVDVGHSVHMERKGVSAKTHNQRMEFLMSVTNPAAAAQIMIAAARAGLKQKPGCYTLLEIPPIDCLYGDKEELLKKLV